MKIYKFLDWEFTEIVPKCPIDNIPALVQIMAWRRPGDKPLSETMIVSFLTHICVTRLQWVKSTGNTAALHPTTNMQTLEIMNYVHIAPNAHSQNSITCTDSVTLHLEQNNSVTPIDNFINKVVLATPGQTRSIICHRYSHDFSPWYNNRISNVTVW